MSFGKPKTSTPAVTPAPAAPDRSSTQVQEAAAEQRRRFYSSSGGRSTTQLTSGTGADEPGAVARFLGQVGR